MVGARYVAPAMTGEVVDICVRHLQVNLTLMFRVSDVGPARWIDLACGLASESLNIITSRAIEARAI
jgi:hypothetical protein